MDRELLKTKVRDEFLRQPADVLSAVFLAAELRLDAFEWNVLGLILRELVEEGFLLNALSDAYCLRMRP